MKSVAVGVDAHGEVTTAAVLVRAEREPAATDNRRRLAKASRESLAVLVDVTKDGPVAEDVWRRACDAKAGDLTPSGLRKRFTRARDDLVTAGLIKVEGDLLQAA